MKYITTTPRQLRHEWRVEVAVAQSEWFATSTHHRGQPCNLALSFAERTGYGVINSRVASVVGRWIVNNVNWMLKVYQEKSCFESPSNEPKIAKEIVMGEPARPTLSGCAARSSPTRTQRCVCSRPCHPPLGLLTVADKGKACHVKGR